MKFVCLGFMNEDKWNAMSHGEQEALMEECLAYDDVLCAGDHWTGSGEALQSSRNAKTLRLKGGKVLVTDGPYAETKEQLGGFGVFQAEDIDEAVELMSQHPGVRDSAFEIRPIEDEMTQRCGAAEVPDAAAEGSKFVCLGYGNENNWNALSPSERDAMLDQCIAYGDELRRQGGGWVGGQRCRVLGRRRPCARRGARCW